MAQQRIPFAGLSQSLMPMILRMAGERRAEQHRLQGKAEMSQAMTTWYDPDIPKEEKIPALAHMFMGGAPVTGAMMQSLEAEQDLDPFFEKLGIRKDDPARVLWNMGALSRQQLGADLLKSFKEGREEKDFEKSLQTLFDAGLVKLDGIERSVSGDGTIRTQVEQLKAIADYKKKYGQEAADVVMREAGMMGVDTQWQSVLSQIDSGVSLEDMSAADRAKTIEKVKTPANRAALFGQKGDAGKMFTAGINNITRKARAYFPLLGLGDALNMWATGQESPFLNPTSIAFLEKNFEKTGEFKYDAVVEEGYESFQWVESLADRMNLNTEQKNDVKGMFKYLIAKDFPIEDIDWDKVKARLDIKSLESENLRKWYENYLNANK